MWYFKRILGLLFLKLVGRVEEREGTGRKENYEN